MDCRHGDIAQARRASPQPARVGVSRSAYSWWCSIHSDERALGDDALPTAGADVVEGAAHELGAQALPLEAVVDLGVGEDDPLGAALGGLLQSVRREAGPLPRGPELVPLVLGHVADLDRVAAGS